MNNFIYAVREEKLQELSHKDCVRFAVFCAYQTKNKWKMLDRNIKILQNVELWLENNTTLNVDDVGYEHGADSIIHHVIWATEYGGVTRWGPAYNAHRASVQAVAAIADYRTLDAQVRYYNELRYFDNIFENIVLKGK